DRALVRGAGRSQRCSRPLILALRQEEPRRVLGGLPLRVPHASSPQPVHVRWVLGLGLPPGRVGKEQAPYQHHTSRYFRHFATRLALARVTDCDTQTPGGVTDCDKSPWRGPPATWLRLPCVCPGSRRWPLAAARPD